MKAETMLFVVAGLAALGCWSFVGLYWWQAGISWLYNDAGRYMMFNEMTWGLLLTLTCLNGVFDSWPGREQIIIGTLVLIMTWRWWPLRLLLLSRRAGPKHRQHSRT